jgi:DNA replication protein DnaC
MAKGMTSIGRMAMTVKDQIEKLRAQSTRRYAPGCALCDDYGFIQRHVPWVDPHVQPCVCVRAKHRASRLAAAGIPLEYRGRTFDTYRPYNATLAAALQITRDFAASYPVQQRERTDPSGLLLIGPAGVGKTHLVAALLTQILSGDTGSHGRFYKMRDLLRAMRDSYNPAIQTTERQILEPILTCDLLVLDDLGAERMTDWVADTMDLIVDTRYSAGRPIVATTNFPDLEDPEDPQGLLCRVGFRTHSRLRGMCWFVTLDGADFRDVSPHESDAGLQQLGKTRRKMLPARDLRRGPKPTSHDGKADLRWPGGKGGNN